MASTNPTSTPYDQGAADRQQRMRWWHEARFGMFIHFGLYSRLARHEWAMNQERIPQPEYETLADGFKPKKGCTRAWAKLAKAAGMKYAVLTTKHHEGYSLWDSTTNPYNVVQRSGGWDVVAEFVASCRAEGLKVGFYYSLMDWRHPDGHACAKDEAARRRFCDYTQALVRELMSNYGTIDILWYDVPWPLGSPEQWESDRLNGMVRQLQPGILINDRSQLPEDFGTPEEHVSPAAQGRGWEACMTFNGAWGWTQTPSEDWHSARKVLDLLRACCAGSGNLLLNIGPKPDGSVPAEASERLGKVGRWLKRHGEAVYGVIDRAERLENLWTGHWTRRGDSAFYWCRYWPGHDLAIGGFKTKVRAVRLLGSDRKLRFTQHEDRLVVHGLPAACPDRLLGVTVFRIDCADQPLCVRGWGYESLTVPPAVRPDGRRSPFIIDWLVARLGKALSSIEKATCPDLDDADQEWRPISGGADGFINVHPRYAGWGGTVHFAVRLRVAKTGRWNLLLGYDGGVRVFVDGTAVFCDPVLNNPTLPDRSIIPLELAAGEHLLQIAFDLAQDRGWGIWARWEALDGQQEFPAPA